MGDYRVLEWDTDFFGFRVARITSGEYSQGRLSDILTSLGQDGVLLAYLGLTHDSGETQRGAEALGGVLVDRKTVYCMDIPSSVAVPVRTDFKVEAYKRDYPEPALLALALQSGEYSRFRVDEKMPLGKFEELYVLWMVNSVNGRLADSVLVIREEGKVVSMVTLRARGNVGEIGLIASDSASRGRGMGASLLSAAIEWFRAHKCVEVNVTTQGGNKRACEFYEKNGFRVKKVEMYYHFWLNARDS